jgi:hypothetical protein
VKINDTLTLENLVAPEGAELISDDPAEVTLVTLSPPRVEEEPETEVEVDPELVGEGEGEGEGEESAEGESEEGDGGGEESSGEE